MNLGMLSIYAAKSSVEGLMQMAKFHPTDLDAAAMKRMMTMASLMDRTRRPLVFEQREARFEFDMKLLQGRHVIPTGV